MSEKRESRKSHDHLRPNQGSRYSTPSRRTLRIHRQHIRHDPLSLPRRPQLQNEANDTYYYCFGCGATGKVIDFTTRLFNITNSEAAQKLAQDFGITELKPSIYAKLQHYKTLIEQEEHCFRVLSNYLHILMNWKEKYAPKTPEEIPDPRFTESCRMLDCTQYMLDILTISNIEERRALVFDMMKDDKIKLLAERVVEIKENESENE